jgi:translation initiation factor 2 beta subunit (eIF-2beta)/eIF-5
MSKEATRLVNLFNRAVQKTFDRYEDAYMVFLEVNSIRKALMKEISGRR